MAPLGNRRDHFGDQSMHEIVAAWTRDGGGAEKNVKGILRRSPNPKTFMIGWTGGGRGTF